LIHVRAASCTPVPFIANDHFFGRDSGLINRSLQAIGIESVSIMAGTRHADEPDDLIRASLDQLSSSDWWRSLQLDVVVLYAWGDPRYLSIAKAIRSSGAFLIQNLDSSGIETPYANPHRWWRSIRDSIRGPQPLKARLRICARAIRDLIPRIYEHSRLRMLAESDVLACVSPPARDRMSEYASALGAPDLIEKLHVIPHPVVDDMRYHPQEKRNRVLCVGRWNEIDDHQKDPRLTLQILTRFLQNFPDWDAEVIGRGAESLTSRIKVIPESIKPRIHFTNFLDRNLLREKYLESRILLCASRYESFHISSAEALCCGASVVTARHPLLASTSWFTSDNSGTLAENRSLASFVQALATEAKTWNQGQRDPVNISAAWCHKVHGKPIATQILHLYQDRDKR
jgi:glycosyltransferase involved in cell wall biosynthesis